MENARLIITAMAAKCRGVLQDSESAESGLPEALHRRHLLWMCDRIEQHAEDWPESKLHRWIGFVQGGLLANGILDLDAAKTMFNEVKDAYGVSSDDQDLTDHLDPGSSFRMDVGGEG